jgi:hypothetical protein
MNHMKKCPECDTTVHEEDLCCGRCVADAVAAATQRAADLESYARKQYQEMGAIDRARAAAEARAAKLEGLVRLVLADTNATGTMSATLWDSLNAALSAPASPATPLMAELQNASAAVDAWPDRDKKLRETSLAAEAHFASPATATHHTIDCNEGMTYGDPCSCAPPSDTARDGEAIERCYGCGPASLNGWHDLTCPDASRGKGRR